MVVTKVYNHIYLNQPENLNQKSLGLQSQLRPNLTSCYNSNIISFNIHIYLNGLQNL